MNKFTIGAAIIASVLAAGIAPAANAKGCLKGAVVGGVAGHFVGSGHGLLGAAGGCLVGRHYARKHREQEMRRDYNRGYGYPNPTNRTGY